MNLRVVVKGMIIDKDKALIVRRSLTDDRNPGRWTIPGGHLERGESIDHAALREIREEVGLQVKLIKVHALNAFIGEKGEQLITITFLCKPLTNKVTLNHELHEFKWIAYKDYQAYKLPTRLRYELKLLNKQQNKKA